MNIAVFSHYFAPEISAPSARLLDLGREWVRNGQTVRAVTCFPNHPTGIVPPKYRGKLTLRETMDGIDIFRSLTYATRNRGTIRRTLGHLSYLASGLTLSATRLGPIDVAIGSSPTLFAAVAACLFSIARRIPFIFEVRDLWPAAFVEMGLVKPGLTLRLLESLEMWLYRRAARIVTVTESFGPIIAARGIDPAKIVCIPNGADVNFFVPGPPDADLRSQYAPGASFVALYIGAHGISQHLSTLLTAADCLRDRPDIAFVLVGEGAEKEQVIAEAARRKLPNVRFVPGQPHELVPGFYRMADACFVPLRAIPLFESFIPSKLFEIMACGRPVIGSVSGEARQLLEKSGGALVTEPEDDSAIAQAVAQLADDPKLAHELGVNGRAFVEQHYRRDVLAAYYLDVLNRACAKSASHARG
ncbi:MAG: glycosyltransferase family 4 protein [Aggregatilineales bacterium]